MSCIGTMEDAAVKLDYATFSKAHGFDQRNPFADALREGRVIQNCKIETGGEEDDDWIRFEFGDPNPAIT